MKPKNEITILYKPGEEYFYHTHSTPIIRISNKKIKEVGFFIGEKVDIVYNQGEIIIRKKVKNK